MKNILYILILLHYCTGSMAQKTITIKGSVTGDLLGHQKIYVYGKDIEPDSAVITNEKFEFTIPYKQGIIPLLYDEYDEKVKGAFAPFPLVIDGPGVISLQGADITKGLQTGILSGIKSAEEYQQFDKELVTVSAEGRSVPLFIGEFIKSHPNSYASLYILSGRGMQTLAVKDLEKLYKLLSKEMRVSARGKRISDYINGVTNSSIGSYVKDFTLNTPGDKPFSMKELKGKYVIIDFWASWCGPCKVSFPHMKEIYNKYKGDKFEIYSISIDKSKEDWLNELDKLKLPWLQTLDTKNVALSSFAVSAVPTTYMIDPEGKIILKEVGFNPNGSSPLEKKLAELFTSTPH